MRKRLTAAGALAAAALVLATAAPALASTDVSYGGKDCAWPNHAGLHLESKGTQYIKVRASNGTVTSGSWWHSDSARLHRVHSASEDAKAGYVYTSWSNIVRSGWDSCPW